jgi:hypothetical protein
VLNQEIAAGGEALNLDARASILQAGFQVFSSPLGKP